MRSQPRGGTPQQAHAYSRLHHRFLPTKILVLSGACFKPRRASRVGRMIKFKNRKTRPVPDRKPSQVTDQKVNERFRNRFRKPRDGKTGRYIVMRLMHTMQKKTRALKVCDGFLGILSGSNSLRFLEACADVHNAKETIYNWEDTETQGTTAYNRHERAPSSGLPKVGTTDHKRTPATLQ